MSWDEKKIEILRNEWGKGKTASQIAELIGGVSRNAVIGKAHRLNLSAKIKTKNYTEVFRKKTSSADNNHNNTDSKKKISRSKFKSLLIEKDFEPENPKQLEELTDNDCKYPIGHPDEENFYFCGRTSLKDFSYCKLHLLYSYQSRDSKNKKDDQLDKDEVPEFIEKKIKSA